MGLSTRKLGLVASQTRKTSAFFLRHDQRSFCALPAPFAAPLSPFQAERESLIQLLTSTVLGHSGGSRSAPSVVRARFMSSSVRFLSVDIEAPNYHFLTSTRAPRPYGTPQEQQATRSKAFTLLKPLQKTAEQKNSMQ